MTMPVTLEEKPQISHIIDRIQVNMKITRKNKNTMIKMAIGTLLQTIPRV